MGMSKAPRLDVTYTHSPKENEPVPKSRPAGLPKSTRLVEFVNCSACPILPAAGAVLVDMFIRLPLLPCPELSVAIPVFQLIVAPSKVQSPTRPVVSVELAMPSVEPLVRLAEEVLSFAPPRL